MPKVSIIVPIYNVEKYLDRCMQSLLHQTLREIEIILVDDESPDNCPAMCDEYARQDARVKVIHKKNGGLGFARNSGLEIAIGEYVAFVDSDDFVKVTMYEELYSSVSRFNSDAILGGFIKVNADGLEVEYNEVETLSLIEAMEVKRFLLEMIGNSPNIKNDRNYAMSVWRGLYSLKLIRDKKIFFPSERDLISEDLVFHYHFFLSAAKVLLIPDKFYYYCANGTSLSLSYRKDRFEKYKKFQSFLKETMQEAKFERSDIMRVDRLFIGYCRSLLLAIPSYDISEDAKDNLYYEIGSDRIWKEILSEYPYGKLIIKYSVVCFLLKNNLIFLLKLLSKISYRYAK